MTIAFQLDHQHQNKQQPMEEDGATSTWWPLVGDEDDPCANVTECPYYGAGGGGETTLPPHLTLNEDSLFKVSVYGVLFVVAAIGNLTVFIALCRSRHRRSRINLMIMHLAVADLIVTFVMIPLEIGWRLTVQWVAGDAACKAFLFFRAFGLYLSSMVLVCVSLDRYFAIIHPLRVNDAQRRSKIMLLFAWSISVVCSVPQSIVFHVQHHPEYPFFRQCVTFNSFPTPDHELAYNFFCMMAMYGVPLLIIVFVYTRILWEISKKSRETRDEMQRDENFRGRMRLRRSDMSNIERARSRTLRMTVIIVAAFFWCWTPYFVMTMWYMFDRASAKQVDSRLQDTLFMFAVSNSCVNPLVYGTYAINFRREFTRCLCRKKPLLRRKNTGSVMTRVSRETTVPSTTCNNPVLVTTPPLVKLHMKANGHVDGHAITTAYDDADLRSLSMISEKPESNSGH